MGRLTSPYDPSLIQMLYIWLTLSPYLAHPIYNTLYTYLAHPIYVSVHVSGSPYIQHIWLTLYTTPYIQVCSRVEATIGQTNCDIQQCVALQTLVSNQV